MSIKKLITIILITLLVMASSCKTHQKGGTRQPKTGPMPCPIKDCE